MICVNFKLHTFEIVVEISDGIVDSRNIPLVGGVFSLRWRERQKKAKIRLSVARGLLPKLYLERLQSDVALRSCLEKQ